MVLLYQAISIKAVTSIQMDEKDITPGRLHVQGIDAVQVSLAT